MTLSRSRRVYFISALTDFAYMLFIFTVTRRLAEGGATPFLLGIVGGASSFGYALGGSLAGHVSDRWGRPRLIAFGALGQMAAFLLASYWYSKLALYMLTGLVGISAGFVFVPMIAWLTEGAHHSQRTTGTSRKLLLFCIAWNLGVISGQTAGGWLFSFGPTLVMLTSAGLMALVLLLTFGPAPNSTEESESSDSLPARVLPERARAFVYLAWTANIASALSVSMIIYLFPYLAKQLAISPPTHGMMLASQRAVVVATFLLMRHFTFWQYRLQSSLTAQAAAVAGLLLLTVGNSVPILTASIVLVGVLAGYNYFSGAFYSTTGFEDAQKGMASGMHEATLAFGFGAGAVLGGLAGSLFGARIPYLACVVAIAISVTIQVAMFLKWRRRWVRTAN